MLSSVEHEKVYNLGASYPTTTGSVTNRVGLDQVLRYVESILVLYWLLRHVCPNIRVHTIIMIYIRYWTNYIKFYLTFSTL